MSILEKAKELAKKRQLNSVELYSVTKYGEPMTEDQIFDRYVANIDEMLESKARRGFYSLVIDADPGFPEISNRVIDVYINRGFICFLLDSSIDKRILNPQIFIGWNR